MIYATFPAIVALIGALVYALSASAKAAELGRIAFAAGLLVALVVVADSTVELPW